MEVAKALGGSFKLVTLAPKTKGDDSTAHGNIKELGYTNKSKSTNEHTQHTTHNAQTQAKYTIGMIPGVRRYKMCSC